MSVTDPVPLPTTTSRFWTGVTNPIPTFPAESILIRSIALVVSVIGADLVFTMFKLFAPPNPEKPELPWKIYALFG